MKNSLFRLLFVLLLFGLLPTLMWGQKRTHSLTFQCEDCETEGDQDGDGLDDCEDFDCIQKIYPFRSTGSESRSSQDCSECFENMEEFRKGLSSKIEESLIKLERDGFIERLEQLYEFYQCVSDGKNKSYQDQGVIPECVWMGENGTPSFAFMSGLIDGAYIEVADIIAFFQNYESISEIISTYTMAGVMSTIYGCEQYDVLVAACGNFTENDLKQLLAEELQKLDESGASILSQENIILQGKYANVPTLAAGCNFRNKVQSMLEVLDLYVLMNQQIDKLADYFDGLSQGDLEDWYKAGKISVSVFDAILNVTKITKINKFLDWIANADPFEMASLDMMRKNPDVLKAVNDSNGEGLDGFDALEDAIQTTNKKTWPEVLESFKKGNDFNRKSIEDGWYDYHEIHLENGKKLDSYDPDLGEIVSRKATNFDEIQPATFEKYLQELDNKYSSGTIIRSDKYPDIDGQPLQGTKVIEVPSFNQDSPNLSIFEELAEQYNTIIRFRPD